VVATLTKENCKWAVTSIKIPTTIRVDVTFNCNYLPTAVKSNLKIKGNKYPKKKDRMIFT
jgi:hypothetical protein